MKHKALFIVLLAAFIARITWGLFISKDAFYFYKNPNNQMVISSSLIEGKGYSWYGVPTAYERPGYVLFLSAIRFLTFNTPEGILTGHALLGVIGTLLIFLLASKLAGNRTAIIAAAIYSLNPIIIRSDLRIQEYAFFSITILLIIYLYMIHREKNKMITALLLGLAMSVNLVTRPLGLILVIYIFVIIHKQGLRFNLLTFLAAILFPIIWGVRTNHAIGRYMFLDSTGGARALYSYNSEEHAGFSDMFNAKLKTINNPHKTKYRNSVVHLEFLEAAHYYSESFKFILNNPLKYASLVCARFALLFSPVRLPRESEYEVWSERQTAKDAIYFFFLTPLLVLFLLAFKHCFKRHPILIIAVLSISILQSLVTTGSSYTSQLFPLMCVMGAMRIGINGQEPNSFVKGKKE